jgi:hypothetical protein
LFLVVRKRLRRSTPITITVELPLEYTKVPLELHCRGRVVRWNQPEEQPGMGAIIDDYELRRMHRRGSAAADRRSKVN